MKTLFIIGVTLFILFSLLKKATRLQSSQPSAPQPDSEVTRASLTRKLAENPDDARLWAELGAVLYLDARSRGLDPENSAVTQADEHFRTAASLAPNDASILLDWTQWKVRSVANDDDLRMSTYHTFVKPKLQKAAELEPENGEFPYYHALLLVEIAENQLLMAEGIESIDDAEYHKLLHERDLILWDAIDLAHQAERKRHDRAECLTLRAGLFVALSEEREGGEEKYLLQEAKTSLDEYRRLSGEAGVDEGYITLSLQGLREEPVVPVARPARHSAAVSSKETTPSHLKISAPVAPVTDSPERRLLQTLAGLQANRKDAISTADLEAKSLEAGLLIPDDALRLSPAVANKMPPVSEAALPTAFSIPVPAISATNPDHTQAAAVPVSSLPTTLSPRADSSGAPDWSAPSYSAPDYARPQNGTPVAQAEPNGTDKTEAARPLSYRPISR